MGAFASLTIPVTLPRQAGAASAALEIAMNFAGSRNATIDPAAGTLNLDLAFPGHVSGLVRALHGIGAVVGNEMSVSLPVRSYPGMAPDVAHAAEHILQGPEVQDNAMLRQNYVHSARIVGDRVEATTVPSTSALEQIYNVLIAIGIIPQDEPTLPTLRGL